MNRIEYLQAVKKLLPIAPVCAEIGVYRGDFSKMILEELQPQGLLLVDSFSHGSDVYEDGNKVEYSTLEDCTYVVDRFFKYDAVNVIANTSEEAADLFAEYLFDFIYIDADHRYESVKRDLEMWYELLSDVGFIGGHDYGNEVFTGVKKAVDEFCEERNLKIVLLSGEGDFILRKIKTFMIRPVNEKGEHGMWKQMTTL